MLNLLRKLNDLPWQARTVTYLAITGASSLVGLIKPEVTPFVGFMLGAIFSFIFEIALKVDKIDSLAERVAEISDEEKIKQLQPAMANYIMTIDKKRRQALSGAMYGSMSIDFDAATFLASQLNNTKSLFIAVSSSIADEDLWYDISRRAPYIEAMKKAIDRGVVVQRVFVAMSMHEIFLEADIQRNDRIQVKWLPYDKFAKISHQRQPDIGVFDDAMAYIGGNNGSGRVTTNKMELKGIKTDILAIWSEAEDIPPNITNDSQLGMKVYDTPHGGKKLLDAWDNKIPTAGLMTPAISDPAYKRFLLALIYDLCDFQSCNRPRILSIGAGTGKFESILLRRLHPEIVCLDVRDDAISIMQRKGLTCVKADCTEIPKAVFEMPYDLVLIDGVAVHLGDSSLLAMLTSIHTLVKHDTSIIVSSDVPLTGNQVERHERAEGAILRSPKRLEYLIRLAGFDLKTDTPIIFPYYRPTKGLISRCILVFGRN